MYEAMPRRLPDLHTRFVTHTLCLFEKHEMENIGYWTEVFDTSNRLVYMLGDPSLGEREKSWAVFLKDLDWQTARVESEKNDPRERRVENLRLFCLQDKARPIRTQYLGSGAV